jgi:transcriptional regulator GlxA family with amidase domain
LQVRAETLASSRPAPLAVRYRGVNVVPHHHPSRSSVAASQRKVVDFAEAYVRAHLDAPIPLARLCRMVGLSERGLRNAFYGVHGISPKRWMLAERLLWVRRALSDAAHPTTTVTRVAMGFGFYDLGRFAAVYKVAFGEAPSETLRGAQRKSA